jgi:hypothetical protein
VLATSFFFLQVAQLLRAKAVFGKKRNCNYYIIVVDGKVLVKSISWSFVILLGSYRVNYWPVLVCNIH